MTLWRLFFARGIRERFEEATEAAKKRMAGQLYDPYPDARERDEYWAQVVTRGPDGKFIVERLRLRWPLEMTDMRSQRARDRLLGELVEAFFRVRERKQVAVQHFAAVRELRRLAEERERLTRGEAAFEAAMAKEARASSSTHSSSPSSPSSQSSPSSSSATRSDTSSRGSGTRSVGNGQSLVEFALVLPLMLAILLGVIGVFYADLQVRSMQQGIDVLAQLAATDETWRDQVQEQDERSGCHAQPLMPDERREAAGEHEIVTLTWHCHFDTRGWLFDGLPVTVTSEAVG